MNTKNMALLRVLFIISWFSLVVFAALFVAVKLQNIKLSSTCFILEQKTKALSEKVKDCQKSEDTGQSTLDYLQWQFIVNEQVDKASARLKEEIAKIKDLKKNKDLAGLLYYNLGLSYDLAQDFDSAIKAFEEAVSLQPKDADSYYNLGLLYSTFRMNTKKAVKNYQKYLELAGQGTKADEVRERINTLIKKR